MQPNNETIREQIAAYLRIPTARMDGSTSLAGLVPDSFMLVELLIRLQEEYGIRLFQEDIEKLSTVSDLEALIVSRVQG